MMNIEAKAIEVRRHRRLGAELNVIGSVINTQRECLAEVEAQLKALNERFPGERKKSECTKNPIYRAEREHLLEQKRTLAQKQGISKSQVRGRLRFMHGYK